MQDEDRYNEIDRKEGKMEEDSKGVGRRERKREKERKKERQKDRKTERKKERKLKRS